MEKEVIVQISLDDLLELKQRADLYKFVLKERDELQKEVIDLRKELKNRKGEKDAEMLIIALMPENLVLIT